jgi:ADP-heptose:LPS heptosyltransferase
MIGDHIIFGGFLEQVRRAWPKTRLVLVAPIVRHGLYDHCPCIDRLITYDYRLAGEPGLHRRRLYCEIRDEKPDWIINPMSLRSMLSDRIARYCRARIRIGLKVPGAPKEEAARRRFDRYYTHLVSHDSFKPSTPERLMQGALLSEMGISASPIEPRIWTSPEDAAFANQVYDRSSFVAAQTLVYFSTASSPLRSYPRLKFVLAQLLEKRSLCSVIAIGGEAEREENHAPREILSSRWLNLCGRTTMTQSAEIMRRCRLVVGVDTGPMHAARAVKARHVVLVGGMLFGRFFPNPDDSASVIAYPLDCYFCDGKCRYERAHCLTDIPESLILAAVEEALEKPMDTPRLYFARGASNEPILASTWSYGSEPEIISVAGRLNENWGFPGSLIAPPSPNSSIRRDVAARTSLNGTERAARSSSGGETDHVRPTG